MTVEYLSEDQIGRYGRFAGEPSVQELEEFFRLDAVALEKAASKRRAHNRAGWAVQWGTVRMLGTFLKVPAEVPPGVAAFVAEQLGIDDPSCLKAYPERLPTQHEHAREIRELLKVRDFEDGDLALREHIAGRVWVSGEGPRALFDRAVTWLLRNRVLLPGLTQLARLVGEVRAGEQALIYSVVDAPVEPEFRRELLELLTVPDGAQTSVLERWRKGPRDVSGRGQKAALERVRDIGGVGAGGLDLWRVPPVKLAELARYGMGAHAPTLRRLAEPRRTATVLATMRRLEGSSIDDALTLFDVLMATKLLARAEREDGKAQLKGLPKLRKAAAKLRGAVSVLLDVPIEVEAEGDDGPVLLSFAQAWERVERLVTREELAKAIVDLAELLPDGGGEDADASWRRQLLDRYATVRPFTSLLAEVVPWGATKAGAPIVQALKELPKVQARRKPGPEHIDVSMLDGTWRRLVLGNPLLAVNGLIDKHAWTFCVLEALHNALRRRDVFARGADNWGDPRARLLSGPDWQVNRPRVLTALELSGVADEHLGELEVLLDEMYAHVAEGLPGNAAVDIVDGKIRLDRLEADPEPAGYQLVRDAVAEMLPKVDYPELLLEVHARTGMFDPFEHIGGKVARPADLDLTLTALLVSKSTNIGLEPVIKPGEKALTRSRLAAADWGYFHLPGMSAASGLLVGRQGDIPLASDWGGGHVASADGMRFTVPLRSIHSRPNRKYFSTGRGATWLNVVSDRVMGLGGIVMPGTLRDSLGILDAMFNLDGPVRPEIVITDTGSYSDLVFGLFAICGYQFSPRIADISDARLWRFDLARDYGPLQPVSRQRVQVERIRQNWEDMLRVAGSLQTGKVRAYDLLRMMTSGDRMTGLGDAFAHYGRIFKTLHLLQFIDSEAYRRMIGVQLNIGEGRHALARRIFFGRLGELRHGYREGMEDQLGALGMALNAVVWWNTLYMDAAVRELEIGGVTVSKEIRSRLSPLVHEHINFHGRYPIVRSHGDGSLRPLRDPDAAEE
ncbi:Tn3 family transposase [Streptomyces sp. NBC_01549]|uniref:Tn3 family transposase n=1 Tax=Streptomyces sp. NBC_01549 TaxID=2975874 RepID=UPI00225A8617|nr:Tn3 family transposase [Streptomyces sp. NBC_01549]MCX4596498.1 Tn3 family transposase [Streptomyces sp. NBC_01549]